jgi:hypothetical protein
VPFWGARGILCHSVIKMMAQRYQHRTGFSGHLASIANDAEVSRSIDSIKTTYRAISVFDTELAASILHRKEVEQ